MSDLAYRASDPSRVRACDSPLRQRLIGEVALRPDRNEPIAPEPRDRLMVVHVPRWVPVLRMGARERLAAERHGWLQRGSWS